MAVREMTKEEIIRDIIYQYEGNKDIVRTIIKKAIEKSVESTSDFLSRSPGLLLELIRQDGINAGGDTSNATDEGEDIADEVVKK
jgi:hypothetical protein